MALAPDIIEAHYTRLCPDMGAPYAEDKLKALSDLMKDSVDRQKTPGRPDRTAAMPSGYVYLGQFVDHDLTRDATLVEKAIPCAAATPNYRTPRLDLDTLYGKDPSSVPGLYEADGRLKLGPSAPADDGSGKQGAPNSDLYRDGSGTPQIIDNRNDENVVIAQMHVLFAKLHNRLLELAKKDGHGDAFVKTRRLVTWIYQWIVFNDFLPRIIKKEILNEVRKGKLPLFKKRFPPGQNIDLPIEFTVAAFRFGHSMVQNGYVLDHFVTATTETMIHKTKQGGGIGTSPLPSQLPTNFVINWDFFFTANEGRLNRGDNIDTFIAEALYRLPKETIAIFRLQSDLRSLATTTNFAELMLPLPQITLKRGSKMQLPSGEQVANHFRLPKLKPEKIPALPQDRELFEDTEFRGRTPLWYYLLREAAVEWQRFKKPRTGPEPPIQKLGSIGSRIVAETIFQVLSADKGSIFNDGIGWSPPTVLGIRLDSMPAIVEYVKAS
jgi:hypothetical protein